MKRVFILLTVMLAFQAGSLFAQTSIGNVVFNAQLDEVFQLTVTAGGVQDAWFATADDYNNGIIEGVGAGSIDPGISTVTMESTLNWNVTIEAPDFAGGGFTIPINNLGVYITDDLAVHKIGTEILCNYTTPATILGLSNAAQALIGNEAAGGGNSGTATDNIFDLHWEMGTLNGTMNAQTMLEQMAAAGGFPPGAYTTTVVLTMTPD